MISHGKSNLLNLWLFHYHNKVIRLLSRLEVSHIDTTENGLHNDSYVKNSNLFISWVNLANSLFLVSLH